MGYHSSFLRRSCDFREMGGRVIDEAVGLEPADRTLRAKHSIPAQAEDGATAVGIEADRELNEV